MSDRPKISIIIPVYNEEDFLEQCLESALCQTLPEIEIICVDDGSTDRSGEMLDDYAREDYRIRVIHKENGGYGMAMNTGISIAEGEYVCVLESDDMLLEDSCEILYKYAKRFNADVVCGDCFDLSTRYKKLFLSATQITEDLGYYYRLICPNKEPKVYTFAIHSGMGIYNMDFLREKNIRYNETPGAAYQENGFLFQIFMRTERIAFIPRQVYCYRTDNPFSSHNDPEKVYTMTEEFRYIRGLLSAEPDLEKALLPAFYAKLFSVYNQMYKRISPEYRKKFGKFFHKQFIRARDAHLLDIEYFTDEEERLLSALLRSSEAYDKLVLPCNKSEHEKMQKAMDKIEVDGWKSFIHEAAAFGKRRSSDG